MTCTTCLVFLVSTVNDRSKRSLGRGTASGGHITNLKQSIISLDIYGHAAKVAKASKEGNIASRYY